MATLLKLWFLTLVLNQNDFTFLLNFRRKWLLAANVNNVLYVSSADALTNRRRRAANIVRVLCQSEEGDHVKLLIELNRGREL